MAYELVIFDWDGTLVDSAGHIVKSIRQGAASLGLPLPSEADAANVIGLSMPAALKTLYPEMDDAGIEAVRKAYSRFFLLPDSQATLRLFEGVKELLASLRQRQRLLALATGKSRQGLTLALGQFGLDGLFHSSRCADETRTKPDPLMLEELLAETGISVKDAVMVGDTTYDLEMADRVGMDSIAVRYGVHDDDRLAAFSPVAMVDRPLDIIPLVC